MLQALIYSLVIGYAAAIAIQPAPCTCTSNADCGRNQCCFRDDILIASKKRQEASILPIDLLPISTGTCQDYQQDGESCGGLGCGCAPGLICEPLLLQVSRAAENDTSSLSSSRLAFPSSRGICRAPPNNPPCGGQQCTQDSDCARGCCFYDYPIASKRLVAFPASGECRPYQGYGEPCFGNCGCEPGLFCNYNLPPISIVSRAVAADADASLIAPLPGSCRYTSGTIGGSFQDD